MSTADSSDPTMMQLPSGETDLAQAVLHERREGLIQRLDQGASGSEIVSVFTDLVDSLLIGQYRNVLYRKDVDGTAGNQHCCLVAVGGYGRRELSPYSDIDVMVLYEAGGEQVVSLLSSQVFRHLWDLGFQVGHSVRSSQDCMEVATADLSVRTALMEARFLTGSANVYEEFRRRFTHRLLGRRVQSFIQEKVEERSREYSKFGETVYLLEPNLKKTKGGLRDLHLLQWVGMARYQAATLQELANRGVLAHQDYMALVDAREFLWKVRAFLHLEAGRAQEILTFEEQMRLSKTFGFEDKPHLLAVEQFMQQYYRHTTGIHERCIRFIDRSHGVSTWTRIKRLWPKKVVDGHFRVMEGRISIPPEKLMVVLDSPRLLLEMFRLAQDQNLTIEGAVLEEIHRHMESVPAEVFHHQEICQSFRSILSGPGPVAGILRLMHQSRVLEKLLPSFARVRGLMQFNQYHKFTVDEHSLLAVSEVERLGKQRGIFQEVYAEIRQKDLLHLALLLHDVGKGLPEDHSDVGLTIARKVSTRFRLSQQDARTLEFLVHKHLLMANTAFRRDPFDDKVLLTFVRSVGTAALLRKLFLLTAADIAAVGPATLTKWKESLLIELYLRALPEVEGGQEGQETTHHLKQLTRDVIVHWNNGVGQSLIPLSTLHVGVPDPAQIEKELNLFPVRYLSGTAPERIAVHLRAIHELKDLNPRVDAVFDHGLQVCEYSLIALDTVSPGIFLNVTGVLAARGLEVLDAQIITRRDGIVVDTFHVRDPDFDGAPTPKRLENVSLSIISVLRKEVSVENLMHRHHRVSFGNPFPVGRHPTEVLIDNETSDQYTIIDVFADDRQGLLYVLAKTLFSLGLSIHAARIATRLDQIVDVFYVTGSGGLKIESAERCEEILRKIHVEVETFLSA